MSTKKNAVLNDPISSRNISDTWVLFGVWLARK
jgi:hypothetical protein